MGGIPHRGCTWCPPLCPGTRPRERLLSHGAPATPTDSSTDSANDSANDSGGREWWRESGAPHRRAGPGPNDSGPNDSGGGSNDLPRRPRPSSAERREAATRRGGSFSASPSG